METQDRGKIQLPYFSHSFCNDVHVLLGSTSKMFPHKGMPGGCGIDVVIITAAAETAWVIEILQKRNMVVAETGGDGGLVAYTIANRGLS